jgi:NADH-quinone oxidoreductase subunit C
MASKFTNEEVYEHIKATFGDKISEWNAPDGMLTFEIEKESTHDLIAWLKKDEKLAVTFLTNLGAVHYPEDKGREIAMVYHLHSLVNGFRIRLKTFFSIDNPTIKTITDIHVGANWMERETFDFYGVNFEGHPNLKRILNEDSMDYFPMRKEYQLEDATREDKDNRFFGR